MFEWTCGYARLVRGDEKWRAILSDWDSKEAGLVGQASKTAWLRVDGAMLFVAVGAKERNDGQVCFCVFIVCSLEIETRAESLGVVPATPYRPCEVISLIG